MNFILLLFTLIFLTMLCWYFYCSWKRPTYEIVSNLIINALTFLETFFFTKIIIFLFGNFLAKRFSSFIMNLLKVTEEEWLKDAAIFEFTTFLSRIIIGVLGFLFLFLILFFINHQLKKKIFIKGKKKSYHGSKVKDYKVISITAAFFSFSIVSFAFFFPFGALSFMVRQSIQEVNYIPPQKVETLINQPVIRLYSNQASENFFNQITALKKSSKIKKNSTELKSIFTMVFATLDMKRGNQSNKNIVMIKEELSHTYLVPNFLSEFCANAASRFKNNQPFMGKKLKIPTNNSKLIYYDLLEIVSNWKRENLIDDISMIFQVNNMLQEYQVKKISDTTALVAALSQDEFSEELFLTLFQNEDFKAMIPSFMNFGIITILEKANIKSDGNFITVDSLDEMTKEDIKKEARIFSLAIRQIMEINNLKEKDITIDDINRIINNLKALQDSKLFNEALYHIVYQFVLNIKK